MNRAITITSLSVLFALCAITAAQQQQDDPKGPQRAIKLFNGENLDGWVWFSHDKNVKMEDVWSVRDGKLHCKGKPLGYIRTEDDYESYVLTLQIRHVTPGNGGILLRADDEPIEGNWPKSVEAQGMSGALGDIWNIGEFPMKTAPDRTKGRHTRKSGPDIERPVGEWNDYVIILDGGNLTLIVNGVVQNEAADIDVRPGKICLQSEGSEYEFRNIVLVPLERK